MQKVTRVLFLGSLMLTASACTFSARGVVCADSKDEPNLPYTDCVREDGRPKPEVTPEFAVHSL